MLNDGGPNGMEFKDIERTTTQDFIQLLDGNQIKI